MLAGLAMGALVERCVRPRSERRTTHGGPRASAWTIPLSTFDSFKNMPLNANLPSSSNRSVRFCREGDVESPDTPVMGSRNERGPSTPD